MTYSEAWKIYRDGNPLTDWNDPLFEQAVEHIRITDYDLQAGIISSVTEYDN